MQYKKCWLGLAFTVSFLTGIEMAQAHGVKCPGINNGMQSIKGQIIVYAHANEHGPEKTIFNCEDNLNATDDNYFNDKVSSFVIVSGQWKFFQNLNYDVQMGYTTTLGPGVYNYVGTFGIGNDQISSLCAVGTPNC
jgi:Beta/Gamma crystallin